MKGLIVTLLVVVLIIGALYTTGIFNGGAWHRFFNFQGRKTTGPVGSVTKLTQTVQRGTAQNVTVALTMGAGRMYVKGGAESLMNAAFSYSEKAWKPEVQYDVQGTNGSLSVVQPDRTTFPQNGSFPRDWENDWDIALDNRTPMDLRCDIGAGELTMDLSKVQVRSLKLDLGANGSSVVANPRTMTAMDIKAGVGGITLDLGGAWAHDASVTVRGGVGNIELTVPRQTGVLLEINHGLGAITTPGFSGSDNTLHNAAYGTVPVNMTVHIDAGVGSITVKEQ